MKMLVLQLSVAIAEFISLLDRSRVMIHAAIDARRGLSDDDGIGMIVRLGGGSREQGDEGKEDAFMKCEEPTLSTVKLRAVVLYKAC